MYVKVEERKIVECGDALSPDYFFGMGLVYVVKDRASNYQSW
jgi:hypothetical protein